MECLKVPPGDPTFASQDPLVSASSPSEKAFSGHGLRYSESIGRAQADQHPPLGVFKLVVFKYLKASKRHPLEGAGGCLLFGSLKEVAGFFLAFTGIRSVVVEELVRQRFGMDGCKP